MIYVVETITYFVTIKRNSAKRMTLQAHIIGTGSSTPKRILSNKDLESIVDTTDEWIMRRSGIKGAHVLLVSFGAGLTWAASVLRWSI
ncbi:MAG: hypothetical protein IMF11_04805 [Proteobacteria bacterium]|nr:hypothetical protein [Pseudomonadota bacterium]